MAKTYCAKGYLSLLTTTLESAIESANTINMLTMQQDRALIRCLEERANHYSQEGLSHLADTYLAKAGQIAVR